MMVKNSNTQEELIVVSMTEDTNGTTFQVLDEETWTPYIIDGANVQISDSRRPARWVTSLKPGSRVDGYPEFMKSGFWEDFFDGKSDSVEIYRSIYPKPDEIAVSFADIQQQSVFGWSDIDTLVAKGWAKPDLAIDFAISRVDKSDDANEIELAGLSETETGSVRVLVEKLATVSPEPNHALIVEVVLTWCQRCYPNADADVFSQRVENLLKS